MSADAPQSADELLPAVYDQLRRLAAAALARERPGQTLSATALVHEAYLRVADDAGGQARWSGGGHFYRAAARAIRRILIEQARRKRGPTRGGGLVRLDVAELPIAAPQPGVDLLALDEALERLAAEDPRAAEVVELHYFAGLTMADSAEALGISERAAARLWAYARAHLRHQLDPA